MTVMTRCLQAARGLGVLALGVGLLGLSPSADAGQVTHAKEGHAYHPVWSLDANTLAFEVNPFATNIYLYFSKASADKADPGKEVLLPGAKGGFGAGASVVMNPSWHPQGIAVFEGSNNNGAYRLYFANPGGATAAEMLSSSKAAGYLTFPAVSKDGNTLTFVASNDSKPGDLFSWNRTTDVVTQLTNTPDSTEMFPSYSADGTKILHTRKQNEAEDIFEVPVAGGTAVVVAGGDGDQSRPVYAAGGRVVYFTNYHGMKADPADPKKKVPIRPGEWDIEAVVGGKATVLAENVKLPLRARPALTTDGEWVAYVSNISKDSEGGARDTNVMMARVDGSKTVKINAPEGNFNALAEPALTVQNGQTMLAFTALPNEGSAWRFLYVQNINSQIPAKP